MKNFLMVLLMFLAKISFASNLEFSRAILLTSSDTGTVPIGKVWVIQSAISFSTPESRSVAINGVNYQFLSYTPESFWMPVGTIVIPVSCIVSIIEYNVPH